MQYLFLGILFFPCLFAYHSVTTRIPLGYHLVTTLNVAVGGERAPSDIAHPSNSFYVHCPECHSGNPGRVINPRRLFSSRRWSAEHPRTPAAPPPLVLLVLLVPLPTRPWVITWLCHKQRTNGACNVRLRTHNAAPLPTTLALRAESDLSVFIAPNVIRVLQRMT